MFKWVWLIILGVFWFAWLRVAVKDVAKTIKWAIKSREKEFYYAFNDSTQAFLGVNFVILFLSSLIYWIWSL